VNIIIKTKNLELNDRLNSMIKSKIGGLEKFIKVLKEDFKEVFVEIEKETKHHNKGDIFKAEAIIHLPRKKLVARSKKDDLIKAIMDVQKELELEIRKYKTKLIETPRRQAKKSRKETRAF
jgi:ribosomal subunit interface protein